MNDHARHQRSYPKSAGSYDEALLYFRDNYVDTMQRMFAAVSQLYGERWNEFFHFAIFDPPSLSWDDAFARTHDRYLSAIHVQSAKSVLELACGRGRLTNLIAERCKGRVTGVDISEAQLAKAKQHKRKNLRFLHHDIMHIDELGERFDAAIYLDAACYLPDKRAAAARIAKVLEPGARLLLVDWCRAPGTTALQEELVLRPFMHDWAISSLASADEWSEHLDDAGLRVLEVDDLNDRVQPNWELAYERAIEAVREVEAEHLPRLLWARLRLGKDGIELIKAQFRAALYIKAAFDSGLLRYVLLLAEKS